MRFGDYLRRRREEKGWTQPEAAAKAAIEQSYLSKLEAGKSYPSEEVFARLVAAYGVDIAEMTEAVASSELAKLREIAGVRAAVLDRQRSHRRSTRGWLLAGLAFLMIGGACLGVTTLARNETRTTKEYVSMGVLKPDEPLDAFDLVSLPMDPTRPDFDAMRARQQDLIDRLDVVKRVTTENRGFWYVENTPEGRRAFHSGAYEKTDLPSPLHWFVVPGLAFLAGSLGCAFIAVRWR
jgi:transcriptional regulator with XRE-family HTH domain